MKSCKNVSMFTSSMRIAILCGTLALAACGGGTITDPGGLDNDTIGGDDIDQDGVDVNPDSIGGSDIKTGDTTGTDVDGDSGGSDVVGGCKTNGDCDDKQVCTDDKCGTDGQCSHIDNTVSCDDGDACTTTDTCTAGKCAGSAAICDDKNPCTDDSCDKVKGCVSANNTKACDDSNACTTGDLCGGGSCAGVAKNCDDSNVCTDDSCSSTGDCVNAPNSATCSDGIACTDDACAGGKCIGLANDASCTDANPCTVDACDYSVGCTNTFAAGACEDGNPCTLADTCTETGCVPGGANSCDDNSVCTIDSCDPASGCVHTPVSGILFCNDGDACTLTDICFEGKCAGTPKPCTDSNPCTDNGCKDGECTSVANTATCDDGFDCTSGDACADGSCVGIPDNATCADGNPCTGDSCSTSGGCVHIPGQGTCTDGDPCTDDICAGAECKGMAKNCNDNNACTADSCEAGSGTCLNVKITGSCDDSNPCTVDDTCGMQGDFPNGICSGTANSCDDGNSCTSDSCNPAIEGGCIHTPMDIAVPCDDKNACTTGEMCAGATCEGGAAITCADDVTCTDDSCNPASGCVFLANTVTCDDGDPCTLNDICGNKVCGGVQKSCPDSNPADKCDVDYCTGPEAICVNSSGYAVADFRSLGWKLEGEWQIANSAGSEGQTFGPSDPVHLPDGSTDLVAGIVVGGNMSNTPHDWYYLTSPALNLTGLSVEEPEFIYFEGIVGMSGAAGQHLKIEYSADNGATWVQQGSVSGELNFAEWTGFDQFFPGMLQYVAPKFYTDHFRLRIGYQVTALEVEVPIVAGLTMGQPRIYRGQCW